MPKFEGCRAGETGFVREKDAFGHLAPDSLCIDMDILLLSFLCLVKREPTLCSLGACITPERIISCCGDWLTRGTGDIL